MQLLFDLVQLWKEEALLFRLGGNVLWLLFYSIIELFHWESSGALVWSPLKVSSFALSTLLVQSIWKFVKIGLKWRITLRQPLIDLFQVFDLIWKSFNLHTFLSFLSLILSVMTIE